MDGFEGHLESLPLLPLLAAALAGALGFHLVPRAWRFQLALALMVIILTIGRLPAIGSIASYCKVGSFATFLLVGYAAWFHPGPRSRLPLIGWIYALVGVMAIVYHMGLADRSFALVIRAQWVFLIVAALLSCRTVVDQESLLHIFKGLFIGQTVSCVITFSSAIVYPVSLQGTIVAGRFTPYDCNPNQIGILFALTAAMGLYFLVSAKSLPMRAWAFCAAALGLAQIVLTVSRTAAIILTIMALPSMIAVLRSHPIGALLCAFALALGVSFALGYAEDINFWRVEEDLDRTYLWEHGMAKVMKRPYFGMFTASPGETFAVDTEDDPHNAYVRFLELFGISLALPLFFCQVCGYLVAARIWLARKSIPMDPLLISVVVAIVAAIFVQGFANNIIYYPTYTWAFLNIFLSCLVMTISRLGGRAGRARQPACAPAPAAGQLAADTGS